MLNGSNSSLEANLFAHKMGSSEGLLICIKKMRDGVQLHLIDPHYVPIAISLGSGCSACQINFGCTKKLG